VVEKQEILVVRDISMSGKVSPNEILKELETNKVKYKFIMVIRVLLLGAYCCKNCLLVFS